MTAFRQTLKTADDLADAGLIARSRAAEIAAGAERYAVAVTPAVAARIDAGDPDDPIARQFIPDARELDVLVSTGEQVTIGLLAMAIKEIGLKARSYTGAQVKIVTDSAYTKARILKIDEDRMSADLNEGCVVVVAGFQGVDEQDNITTLGRGGSDTTGVALAAALKADECQIYTDVDGVYTTDPRIVPEARRLDTMEWSR